MTDRAEKWALALILAAFVAVNLATASRSPPVWHDEVMFVDPAANLIEGRGWTSSAWPTQRYGEFWLSNAPLYPLLLAGWMKLWGVHPAAARSLNYFLMAAAAGLFYLTVRRRDWIRSPALRLVMLALLLCGMGVTFCYRSARYDVLGMLLAAVAVLAFVSTPFRGRDALLVIAGFLVPSTGLQLVPFSLLAVSGFWAAHHLARRRLSRNPAPEVTCRAKMRWDGWDRRGAGLMAVGFAGGLICFFAALRLTGAWEAFVANMGLMVTSGPVLSPRWTAAVVQLLAGGFRSDLSLAGVLLAAVCLLLARARQAWPAMAIPLAVSGGMAAAGRWNIAYSWMAYVPGVVLLLAAWESVPPGRWRGPGRGLAAVAIAGAILVGFPLRLARTALEWPARDYRPVRRFVAEYVRTGDVVQCDAPAYYAIRAAGGIPIVTDRGGALDDPLWARARLALMGAGRPPRGDAAGAWRPEAELRPRVPPLGLLGRLQQSITTGTSAPYALTLWTRAAPVPPPL